MSHQRFANLSIPIGMAALAATTLASAIGVASLAEGGPKAVNQAVSKEISKENNKEINVYSGRHYNTDKKLYAEFSRRTGIKVNLLEGKDDELIQRLRSEGSRSRADLLVLVDAARVYRAQELGLFQTIRSAELNRDVPANLRDPAGRWYGLTRRARPVMLNRALVNPSLIRTYADLSRSELKGKLCLRNRASVYNQSLTADELVRRGKPATQQWLRGLIANVKQPFFTSDTPMIRAVGQGQCGVTVANQYYLARMLQDSNSADRAAAARVKVVWPNPTHINISAGGVTRTARNPEAARRLLEFLSSPSAGAGYASANNEYPLKGWGNNPTLKAFGTFKPSPVSMEQLGRHSRQAVQLMTQAGWQ
ncbi:MAG: extracellular solute-binding protein [Cyanobacteria bacterium]|nr:extracellular solute-binding protein [Cyanobacteriota bacterium]MDA0886800.1 extracellular solute-binding protein [Cyanobacteriota bacterium]MDA1205606.1 extracellular solute-binding protein [Cyanobacteriota bacterium]